MGQIEELSTIIAISYFSTYFLLLIFLGCIVWNQGNNSITSFFRGVWRQRSIYAAILVHFYDTATDIGVLIDWYILMENERNGTADYESLDMILFFWSGLCFMLLYRFCIMIYLIYNHRAKNIFIYFLCLLDLYILVAVYESFKEAQNEDVQQPKSSNILSGVIKGDPVAAWKAVEIANHGLVGRDDLLTILKSLSDYDVANDKDLDAFCMEIDNTNAGNIDFEKFQLWYKRADFKIMVELRDIFAVNGNGFIEIEQLEVTIKSIVGHPGVKISPDELEHIRKILDYNNDGMISYDEFKEWFWASRFIDHKRTHKHKDIEPSVTQKMVQFSESIIESMPQIILQTVFLIRSVNDAGLKSTLGGSGMYLIVLSIIASVLSVANKFIWLDKAAVSRIAERSGLKKTWPFVQVWYLVRILWRMCDVLVRFIVIALTWTVLGGHWIGIFGIISFLFWFSFWYCVPRCQRDQVQAESFLNAFIKAVITLFGHPLAGKPLHLIPKWIENGLILFLIQWIGTQPFDCGPNYGILLNFSCANWEHRQISSNDALMAFSLIGWTAYGMDIFLWCGLWCWKVVD
eukprot:276217_1